LSSEAESESKLSEDEPILPESPKSELSEDEPTILPESLESESELVLSDDEPMSVLAGADRASAHAPASVAGVRV